MPSIVITINGIGRMKQISASDYTTRLLPALHYFNPALNPVTHPAGSQEAVITPTIDQGATDAAVIEEWADKVIAELISSVEVYEDSKRAKSPLSLT